MARKRWKEAVDAFPVLFTIAVAGWFLLTALGVPTHITMPALHGSEESATETTRAEARPSASRDTRPAAVPVASKGNGPLVAKVTALRVNADKDHPGSLVAETTVDVRNNTDANLDFRTDALVLRSANGRSWTPVTDTKQRLTVPPNMAVVLPVDFAVGPRTPSSTYDLLYQGRVLFSGPAF